MVVRNLRRAHHRLLRQSLCRPCVEVILPIAWVWPILIWSAIGNREIHNNVQQMTFSSASPLWRQLPAQWLAGFIVTLIMASGALVRLGMDGDSTTLLALLSGAFFIPSLALASGVWSGTSKLFEILYMVIWYLGPLNHTFPNWITSAPPAMATPNSSFHSPSR